MAPGIGRQAYCSERAQETVRVQRLVVHDLYVGDPKVPKTRVCTAFGKRGGASMLPSYCYVL